MYRAWVGSKAARMRDEERGEGKRPRRAVALFGSNRGRGYPAAQTRAGGLRGGVMGRRRG